MRPPTVIRQPSFTTDQSLHHCELLAESLFDEKSIATFFTHQEQKDFKSRLIANSLENRDITALLKLGVSNFGFVTTDLRKESWYLLLSEQLVLPEEPKNEADNEFRHRDENQVQLDVNRSFSGIRDPQRKEKLRKLLENVIIHILRKHRQLNYYQGYHDVVSVFIIVFAQGKEYYPQGGVQEDVLCFSDMTNRDNEDISLSTEDVSNSTSSTSTQVFENEDYDAKKGFLVDEEKLFRCVEAFTLLYLRDFMMDSLDFPIDQLRIIPRLIKSIDTSLYKKLQLDKVEPFFAVSSILTVFSHEMKPTEDKELSTIFCIFDYIISTQSMSVPLLMYANLVVENKQRLLEEYDANLNNFENFIDLVHGVMQKVLLGVSHDEKLWDKILQKMRTSVKSVDFSYKKLVNKFSVLVTTAAGKATFTSQRDSQTRYDLNYVENLLTNEIQLNTNRKSLNNQRKSEKSSSFALLHRLSSLTCSSSFIYKISIFIGLMALLIKFHRDGSIKQFIPQIKLYIGNLRSSSLAGLYQESKYVWLDPLHGLLQTMATPVSSMNSSFVVNN
ncbi:hypothetical protein ZYGR_0S00370 [Zygosaccharomyces rouxii]|uniref:ZYRO0F03278p n=2 Tax=Zygosaccharomyces rouxii TaxID=4956 RepID=C5DX96_ZYGRC|nr:uncharacterized protein ZYRO0F03278g [Zygosaccharomyces rouxii]KAH9199171.1 rab-GTPase-TBC domain-containing protein [Zygosaccharomyces rouxii]GAV49904.1 hypothetical protein ZYGR_0S00370 [Zygosaccharomyces rouxii]CAR28407.1 ZYRO0F03278p [Zygosaccharomyces rouxii]